MQTYYPAANPSPSVQSAPDLQVIARVRAGEVNVFEALMRRYNRVVFRTVRSIVRSDAEAEDVSQDAWIAAYQHLDQFEGRAAFSTWVSRIAIRLAMARARRPQPAASLDDLSEATVQPETDPAFTLHRRQLACLLDVEQQSTEEAAESLGLSEENVRIRLHRARAALRALLNQEFDGSIPDVFAFDGRRCDRLVGAVLSQLERPN
jgi:RNA polymerase sigma-70 factor (ECF subfamily)